MSGRSRSTAKSSELQTHKSFRLEGDCRKSLCLTTAIEMFNLAKVQVTRFGEILPFSERVPYYCWEGRNSTGICKILRNICMTSATVLCMLIAFSQHRN